MDVEYLRYKFEDGHDGIITKTKFKLGVRHVQMVYMLLCSLVMGMMRSSGCVAVMSVTDLSRANETYIQIHEWSRKTQGCILSSFFLGYAVALCPADVYLRQVGDKLILTAVLLVNGALSAAMPTIINKGGWLAASNAQLFLGMSQACVTPINQRLLNSWLLPCERRLFSYSIHTALHVGTVIAFPLSGMLAEAHLGWELVYYSQAMMVLSMAAVWVLLTASSPDRHEAVGDTEKEMIREALMAYKKKTLSTPWRRILRSRTFWGLSCARAAAGAVFVFYLSEVPVLLYSQNWSLRTSATQAALPLASLWLVYTMTSPLTEFAHRIARFNYILDIRHFRKIINGFGCLGTVAMLALTPHLILSWYNLTVVAMIMIPAFIGVQLTGFLENHKDVTENFSGTLLMMTSVVAGVVGATVPFVTGLVLGNDMSNIRSWKLMFSGLAAFYLVCNLAYTALASGERQGWDTGDKPKIGYNNNATNMELDDIDDMTSTRQQEPMKV